MPYSAGQAKMLDSRPRDCLVPMGCSASLAPQRRHEPPRGHAS